MTPEQRLLRWYPEAWRARYGDELIAFMEDTYGDRRPPLRARLGIVRAGIAERLTSFGFGSNVDPATRTRGGALLVLCGWACFVVAGLGFAKFTEYWDNATPPGQRRLPEDAFNLIVGAAIVAAILLAAAAVAVVPALMRHLRDGGWRAIRRPVERAAAVSIFTGVWGAGVVLVAHRLTPAQRNGQAPGYGIFALMLLLLVVTTIALWVTAAIATAPHVELAPRLLAAEGAIALAMSVAMTAILSGTVVWWAAEALHARSVLADAITGSSGSATPPVLVVIGLLMTVGLALAATGSLWVAGSLRGRYFSSASVRRDARFEP
ncbi:MAG TPA: hypothetical protein VKV34_02440 [Thermoleophilia bacterium]|nr:hypothetical protein [Thermoleophilia bacterium]